LILIMLSPQILPVNLSFIITDSPSITKKKNQLFGYSKKRRCFK
jgi:hypothetical protein